MDKILKELEAANRMRLAVHTLRNWRHQRKGPPYYKISRSVRYKQSDVEEFLQKHKIIPENANDY